MLLDDEVVFGVLLFMNDDFNVMLDIFYFLEVVKC